MSRLENRLVKSFSGTLEVAIALSSSAISLRISLMRFRALTLSFFSNRDVNFQLDSSRLEQLKNVGSRSRWSRLWDLAVTGGSWCVWSWKLVKKQNKCSWCIYKKIYLWWDFDVIRIERQTVAGDSLMLIFVWIKILKILQGHLLWHRWFKRLNFSLKKVPFPMKCRMVFDFAAKVHAAEPLKDTWVRWPVDWSWVSICRFIFISCWVAVFWTFCCATYNFKHHCKKNRKNMPATNTDSLLEPAITYESVFAC